MTDSLRRRIAIAFAGLLLVALLAVFGLAGTRSGPHGSIAPELPRESLGGGSPTVHSLLASAHGRPALVVFWASWCGPCAGEAPALERFARSAQGRGRIVGVDWSDPERSEARAFIRRYAWSFPVARDPNGTVGASYHLTVLPTTFVLSPQGRIVTMLRGPQSVRSLAHALARAEAA